MHGIRHLLSVLRRVVVAACVLGLGAVSLNAYAFDPYPTFTFAPASGGMGATVTRGAAADWAAAAKSTSGGNFAATFTKTLPFEPEAAGAFKLLFSPRGIGRALVGGAAVAIPLLAGDAISTLLSAACVRIAGGAMTLAPGGQWEECHFSTGTGYWIAGYPEADTLTPNQQTTCDAHLKKHLSWIANGHAQDMVINGTHFCRIYTTDINNYYSQSGYNTDSMQVNDGWAPAPSAQDAEDKITGQLNTWANSSDPAAVAQLQHVLDQEYAAGQPVDGTIGTPPTIQPVITPGKTVTTTNPDGTSTTAQDNIENDYSCQVISNGQAMTCTQYQKTTTTTTTVTPSTPTTSATTSTSTTTTTVTKDPAAADGTDPCKVDPNRLGCQDLGTPAPADALSKSTQTITFTPVTFAGGACPAPVTFTAFGKSYNLDYTTLCDKLRLVSYLLLSLAGLLAAYIFADGFRA